MLCVVVCSLVAEAHAALMQHTDLPGLVLQSESIVVADRTARPDRPSLYTVTRTLRGDITIGTRLELEDGLYDLDGVDPSVVLFLERIEGRLYIVSSGVRVTKDGKVYRFEQWANPGGWARVPELDGSHTQLDRAGFERAITAALRVADTLAAAAIVPPRAV